MSHSERVDPDLVHEIVVADGRMSNPYAEFETLLEKLDKMKPYLILVARDGDYTTYMEATEETGVHTSRQSLVLGTLGLHEDEVENPPLPALVVQATTDPTTMPGDKYFRMIEKTRNLPDNIPDSERERRAMWEDHIQAVREHWQE